MSSSMFFLVAAMMPIRRRTRRHDPTFTDKQEKRPIGESMRQTLCYEGVDRFSVAISQIGSLFLLVILLF